MNPAEFQAVAETAERHGLSVATFLRAAALAHPAMNCPTCVEERTEGTKT